MWIRLCLSRRLRMALRRDQIAELLAQSLTALERLAIFVVLKVAARGVSHARA
jgi:hypothetical protein